MIKVGIIGMGFMGSTHFRVYQKQSDAKVIAIADVQERRARGDIRDVWGNVGEGAAGQLPMDGVRSLTNWRELIDAGDVDLVDICVPTPQHTEIAIAALEAGKHVMCEKPLCLTSAEAKRVADTAARSKGYFMPAQCIRFWPQWAWAKQAIDGGRYGKVLAATFARVCAMPPSPWFADGKSTGGAATDLHIHDTDYICYLFGQPQSVASRGYLGTSGAIDHIVTHYHYSEIPLVCAEGGWAFDSSFPFSMRYRINFQKATADYDIGRKDPLIVYENGKAQAIDCGTSDGYTDEIRYFLDCITNKQKPTVVTAEDAVRTIQVVEAERTSVERSGQPVTLDR